MPPSTVPTPSLLRALRTSITSTSARPPAKPRSLSRLQPQVRHLNTTRLQLASRPPTSRDRGPASNEDTQTDFGRLDIFGQNREPSVAINECYSDGFRLGDGRIVRRAGVLCVGGEAFWWRPWEQQGKASGKSAGMSLGVMKNGQLELDGSTLGILEMVWPRPDLLIVGTGQSILPLSPTTRQRIAELGMRLEVLDTRNASAQFNLLAVERGVDQIATAQFPLGWGTKDFQI